MPSEMTDKSVCPDPKTDWIIKTLRHTVGKSYENYVVTGIWHRLIAKGIELKPVTQQYVRRENGYALLDLYFPDINFAIECDEPQHFDEKHEHTANDKNREHEVLKELGALEFEPTLERIDATKSIQEIDQCIENVVSEIIKIYQKSGQPKWQIIDPVKIVQEKGEIAVNDNLLFKTTCDAINAIGARTRNNQPYKGWQSGLLPLKDGRFIWFPHITTDENDIEKWGNFLLDPKHIVEKSFKQVTPDDVWKKRIDAFDIGKRARYLVFAKVQDSLGHIGYRFFGTFEMSGYDTSKSPFITYWRRVALSERIIEN